MEQMNSESVYEKIRKALKENNGRLPAGFRIDASGKEDVGDTQGKQGSPFHQWMDEADLMTPEQILILAGRGKYEEAAIKSRELFEDGFWTDADRMKLNPWLQENISLVNKQETAAFVKERMRHTVLTEELKFLLDVCGYMNNYDRDLQQMIMDCAMCDELSPFCYPALQKLPEGNEIIFAIAKNTDGTARMNASRALNPDTGEKKKWMIAYGCPNRGGWWPDSAAVAGKCDFTAMLKDPDLSLDDRDRIGWITSTFFEEGPADGLDRLDDWAGLCGTYIRFVREKPTVRGIEAVNHEYQCLDYEKTGNLPAIDQLIRECQDALHDERVISFAKAEIDKGKNLQLASILHIPYDEKKALQALLDNLSGNCRNVQYLSDPALIRQAFDELFQQADFSNAESDTDILKKYAFCFIPLLPEPWFLKETDETFRNRCFAMLAYGMNFPQASGLYFEAVNASETLQENGMTLPDEIKKKLKIIHHEKEERMKRAKQRRQQMQEAERK